MKVQLVLGLLTALTLAGSRPSGAAHWPQFRGPSGDGHAAESSNPPWKWSEEENIRWKTSIHDRGWSSPVVWEDQIWITTATEDGRVLFALCVDAKTGKILRDINLFEVADPQFCHKFNSYASPSPVVEEGRVYLTFGSPGTACLDTDTGQKLWERRDLQCNHFRGAGSSPILHGDLLIMNFDGSDHQYVIALNKHTGETVWKTNRSIDFMDLDQNGEPEAEGDFRKAFSTPHLAMIDGAPVLISIGAKAAYAYHPHNGEEIWRVEERGQHSASTRPVVAGGLVIYPTGFARGQLFAVRTGGHGHITDTHVAWKIRRGVPNKPSVLAVNDRLYMVDDGGIASCLDLASGNQIWNERVGGNHSASPVYARGRLYFLNEEGKTTVVQTSDQFTILAENRLDDGFMASPAIVNDALILRTKTHLYRVEE